MVLMRTPNPPIMKKGVRNRAAPAAGKFDASRPLSSWSLRRSNQEGEQYCEEPARKAVLHDNDKDSAGGGQQVLKTCD